MKKTGKKSNFILQGGILGIAGILTRIIGMIYRIPVTNIIGPEGNGYYAAAFQVYTIMLLISSYSLPLAVSKLVSTRIGSGQYRNADRIFRGAMAFSLITGGIVCLAVFLGADFFADRLMSEPLSAISLRVFAPTLLIVAVMGVMRGYFQGMSTMVPTAISQIVEQVINAVVSIMAAKQLVDYGIRVGAILRNESYGPAYGAAGSSLGTGLGALAGLILLIILLLAANRSLQSKRKNENPRNDESYSFIIRILLITIVPVILSTAIYNISELLSNSIFNKMMLIKGMGSNKSYIWGVYSGEYKVLLNVPIAISNAMSASVVPTLSSYIASRNYKVMRRKISQAMRFTCMIAFPCAIGLGVLAKPIMSMLFRDGADMAAKMMRLGCINIVLYSISTLSNGILQGINKMHVPVRNAAICVVAHVGILYTLLSKTNLGVYSVIIANFCFALFMSLLNHMAIRRYIKYRQEIMRTFVIPACCAIIMGFVIFIFYQVFISALPNTFTTIVSIIVGGLVYVIALVKLHGVSEDEILAFPMGRTVLSMLKSMGLM